MTSLTRAEQLTSGASCRGDDVMPWRSDPGNAKSILGLLDQRQLPSNDIKADGFNEISVAGSKKEASPALEFQ